MHGSVCVYVCMAQINGKTIDFHYWHKNGTNFLNLTETKTANSVKQISTQTSDCKQRFHFLSMKSSK